MVFTATEGSAVAVVYATVLSLFYGSIKIKDIPRIVLDSAKITGTITFYDRTFPLSCPG